MGQTSGKIGHAQHRTELRNESSSKTFSSLHPTFVPIAAGRPTSNGQQTPSTVGYYNHEQDLHNFSIRNLASAEIGLGIRSGCVSWWGWNWDRTQIQDQLGQWDGWIMRWLGHPGNAPALIIRGRAREGGVKDLSLGWQANYKADNKVGSAKLLLSEANWKPGTPPKELWWMVPAGDFCYLHCSLAKNTLHCFSDHHSACLRLQKLATYHLPNKCSI